LAQLAVFSITAPLVLLLATNLGGKTPTTVRLLQRFDGALRTQSLVFHDEPTKSTSVLWSFCRSGRRRSRP